MKRSWTSVMSNDAGSPEAMRIASALGSMFDSETLQSVHDGLTTLNRYGGELYMVAVREKRTVLGDIIPPDEWDSTPGYFSTPMLAHHFSHVGRPKDQPAPEPEPNRGELMNQARGELGAMREAASEFEAADQEMQTTLMEEQPVANGN